MVVRYFGCSMDGASVHSHFFGFGGCCWRWLVDVGSWTAVGCGGGGGGLVSWLKLLGLGLGF